MAISRDASSPVSFALTPPGNDDPTGTSASFTPPLDSVITVCIGCDTAAGTTPTVTISNTGFTVDTWTTHVERGDAEGTAGYDAIASALVTASAAGTVTVTVNNIGVGGSAQRGQAFVDVWTGADTTAAGGKLGDATPNEGSSTTNNITPTAADAITADSRIIGMATDWNALGAGSSTDEETTFHISGTISGMRVYKASDSSSGTSPTLNFDAAGTGAADWNWVAIALKAAAGGPTINSGAASLVSTATLTSAAMTINSVAASLIATGLFTAAGNSYVATALSVPAAATVTMASGTVWRVPTSAATGTSVHITIFSGSTPTYTIVTQGTAVVDSGGNASIPSASSVGTKAFAFVHNYTDDTNTVSIHGGPGIATVA